MILTDLEIRKLLGNGLISIEPNPPSEAYDSTAVNLTLDSLLRIFRTKVPGFIFDPGALGYKAAELIRSATDTVIIPDQGWDLPRGELVLGWTKERVDLDFKGRVAARVEGKSGKRQTQQSSQESIPRTERTLTFTAAGCRGGAPLR